MNHRIIWLALLCFAFAFAATAAEDPVTAEQPATTAETEEAVDDARSANETEAEAAEPTVGAAGMRVFRDPVTGKLRQPTAEERRAMARQLQGLLNRSSEGLTPVSRPDGTVTLDLQGRFRNVSIARRADDGSIAVDCIADHAATEDGTHDHDHDRQSEEE